MSSDDSVLGFNEQERVILFIHGDWSVNDFVHTLAHVQAIYDALFEAIMGKTVEGFSTSLFDPMDTDAIEVVRRTCQLKVKSIEYSSPGWHDLVGVGKVVEQVRLFLEKVIDLRTDRPFREIKVSQEHNLLRKQDLENEKLQLENARLRIVIHGQLQALESKFEISEADQSRLQDLLEQSGNYLLSAMNADKITRIDSHHRDER